MTWMVIWLIVTAILIVMEIISLGLTTIWFAGGALVAALMAYFNLHWMIQIIGFAAVSFDFHKTYCCQASYERA